MGAIIAVPGPGPGEGDLVVHAVVEQVVIDELASVVGAMPNSYLGFVDPRLQRLARIFFLLGVSAAGGLSGVAM